MDLDNIRNRTGASLDGAEAAMATAGYSPADFDAVTVRDVFPGVTPPPPHELNVTYRPSGVTRSYGLINSGLWQRQFMEDLENRAFS